MKEEELIEAACKIEGCQLDDLLFSRVREDGVVVLIIGPAGRKKIVDVEGVMKAVSSGPVTLRPVEPAPTFVELVPEGILVLLKKANLDNPAFLRARSNKELEEVPGIGRAAVKKLREILKQVD